MSLEDNNHLLPTEEEIEEEANNHQYLLKHFKIAKCEYKRFALFGIMFFIIGFIYSFMRIIKDTYVMVRQEPISISYLKVFYIMPISFVIIIIINFILIRRTVKRIFTIFCIIFALLFFAFSFIVVFEEKVLFDPIHIKSLIDLSKLETRGLGFLSNFLLTINEPLATMIYITAEMWGSLILSYLFLSYLNETCTRKQHSRFLPPLFIITNISLLISALVTTLFFKIRAKISFEQNKILMSGVFLIESLMTLIVIFCKYILEKKVINKPLFRESSSKNKASQIAGNTNTKKKGRNEIGFVEGLKIMQKSKFLLAMSTIVFLFSALFNILETVHKNGIKKGAEFYGVEKGKYSGMFNNIEQYVTAISVIILNLSPFSSLIETHGWKMVALIAPMIAAISVITILGFAIYNSASVEQSLPIFNAIFGGSNPKLMLENLLAMICLAAMKIFKFAAFDISKEKISMRIEDKYRPKFKSIFDGIFNKFGKSIGAVYGILLTLFISDLDIRSMSPITSLFTIPAILVWIFAVLYLADAYNTSIENKENVNIDLVEEDEENEEKVNKEKLEKMVIKKEEVAL